jgi:hypothetical protein
VRDNRLRRVDWKSERDQVDLAAVATSRLGPAPGRRGERGGRLWRSCPLGTHEDHNPSFAVDPDKGSWRCFGCGESGDAASLVMRLDGKSFPEAVASLTGGATTQVRHTARSGPKASPGPSGLPEADVLALVEAAEARLWSPDGALAMEYLTGPGRSLSSETIRAARLGETPWVEIPRAEGTTFRALGVVVPWFVDGRLALVKIRQPDERRPKYVEAFRDPARLVCYPGPEAVRPGRPLIVTEGEFDALCLGQAVDRMASVVTLGSASSRPEPGALAVLLTAPRWYVATDRGQGRRGLAGPSPPRQAPRTLQGLERGQERRGEPEALVGRHPVRQRPAQVVRVGRARALEVGPRARGRHSRDHH